MSKTSVLEREIKLDWAEANLKDIYHVLKIDKKILASILSISDRNLERWLQEPGLAEDSYRFQLLKEICIKGKDVVKEEKLGAWLTRAHSELGDYRPVVLLGDIQGFKDVLSMLDSYRAGSYA